MKHTHHSFIDPSELPQGMTDIADQQLYLSAEYEMDDMDPDGSSIYVSKIYILLDGDWLELEYRHDDLMDRICAEIHKKRSDPLTEVLLDIAGGLH